MGIEIFLWAKASVDAAAFVSDRLEAMTWVMRRKVRSSTPLVALTMIWPE
jgi:hypothetical protein